MLDRLVELLISAADSLRFWVVLDPYERGLLIRLGIFKQEFGPGFHWKLPFYVDVVYSDHVVPRTERLAALATTTTDGKSVGFDAVITYRISDLQKALLEVSHLADAIADSCAGIIGTTLTQSTWEEIKNGSVVDGLTAACRKRGWRWGVEIQSVQLTGIAIVRNVRLAVSLQHQLSDSTPAGMRGGTR